MRNVDDLLFNVGLIICTTDDLITMPLLINALNLTLAQLYQSKMSYFYTERSWRLALVFLDIDQPKVF